LLNKCSTGRKITGKSERSWRIDHSYSIQWEADKQYWYDIIYDPLKDRDSSSKEIVMVDPMDRTDTIVVPSNADVLQTRDIWKRILEVPDDIEMNVQTPNNHEYYWNLISARKEVTFTLRTTNFQGDVNLLEVPPHFIAEQMSRALGLKAPPLALCQQRPRQRHGPEITFYGEVPTLSHRLLREHRLAWNLNGLIIHAPQVTTWWIPYNKIAIMRYGNSVNCGIPHDPNEAECPDEPWPMDVTIRIKSHPAVQPLAAPLPAGDPPRPPRSLPPGSWQGLPPSQALEISAAASGLVGYTPVNGTRTVEGQPEEPQDEGLLQFRGTSKKDDLIHAMISWATLESYLIWAGVSLSVVNPAQEDGEEVFHEAQLWEKTEEEWVIKENLHESMKKMDVQVIIEYDEGMMKV
jgi:hypothetical protein